MTLYLSLPVSGLEFWTVVLPGFSIFKFCSFISYKIVADLREGEGETTVQFLRRKGFKSLPKSCQMLRNVEWIWFLSARRVRNFVRYYKYCPSLGYFLDPPLLQNNLCSKHRIMSE